MYEFFSVQLSSYKLHKHWNSRDTIREIRNMGWGVWKKLEMMVLCFPEIVTSAYLALGEIPLDKFAWQDKTI